MQFCFLEACLYETCTKIHDNKGLNSNMKCDKEVFQICEKIVPPCIIHLKRK